MTARARPRPGRLPPGGCVTDILSPLISGAGDPHGNAPRGAWVTGQSRWNRRGQAPDGTESRCRGRRSHLGAYQARSPSSARAAGSRMPRTVVASIRTAAAVPTPRILRSRSAWWRRGRVSGHRVADPGNLPQRGRQDLAAQGRHGLVRHRVGPAAGQRDVNDQRTAFRPAADRGGGHRFADRPTRLPGPLRCRRAPLQRGDRGHHPRPGGIRASHADLSRRGGLRERPVDLAHGPHGSLAGRCVHGRLAQRHAECRRGQREQGHRGGDAPDRRVGDHAAHQRSP